MGLVATLTHAVRSRHHRSWRARGMTDEVGEAVPMGRTCAWCSYAAPADATQCPSCGAALAQRESIGDLVIPGVTSVRADLLDADGRALHIPGASNAQGMASGAIIGAMVGGPVGLAAIGGMAVVSAAEYVAASRGAGDGPALEDVGRPIEAAAKLAQQLDRDGETGPAAPSEPWRDAADPWRDLPG
jgi:RNA polymerase subunit RPABC4/transcription elongation factor Spt4